MLILKDLIKRKRISPIVNSLVKIWLANRHVPSKKSLHQILGLIVDLDIIRGNGTYHVPRGIFEGIQAKYKFTVDDTNAIETDRKFLDNERFIDESSSNLNFDESNLSNFPENLDKESFIHPPANFDESNLSNSPANFDEESFIHPPANLDESNLSNSPANFDEESFIHPPANSINISPLGNPPKSPSNAQSNFPANSIKISPSGNPPKILSTKFSDNESLNEEDYKLSDDESLIKEDYNEFFDNESLC